MGDSFKTNQVGEIQKRFILNFIIYLFMIKMKFIVILIICANSFTSSGFGTSPIQRNFSKGCFYFQSSSDSFFISLENQWLSALQQHDTAYLNQLLSDDFIDISYKGKVRTKEDFLKERVINNNNMPEQLTGIKVRKYKNATEVTGINNIFINSINQKILIRFTDVFVKKGGKWFAISAQETLVK